MRRRGAIALALAVLCVLPQIALGAINARLEGTFRMEGRITFVEHVYGEYRGQRVLRSWTFTPWCATGVCRAVTLVRRRSGRGLRNAVVLTRRARGVYAGNGRFWVALDCAGTVLRRGGLASERIIVRITRTQIIGSVRFATALRATYINPTRVNRTRCPGGIGRDAASYRGQLITP